MYVLPHAVVPRWGEKRRIYLKTNKGIGKIVLKTHSETKHTKNRKKYHVQLTEYFYK